MVAAALFDWDGTLANTLPVVAESFQKVLHEVDCLVSDEYILRRIGIGDRRLFAEALGSSGISFDDELLQRLAWKKNMLQVSMIPHTQLQLGAVELLDVLRSRVRIALATMSGRKVIDGLLREKGLTSYFDVVISADDVHNPKPDPEIFLSCAARMKIRPRDSVVFEDSIFGVEAAKAGCMKCIAVATGVYSAEELEKAGAHLVISSLTKIEMILKFLFSR